MSRGASGIFLTLLVCGLVAVPAASAATPELLLQIPEETTAFGSDAGELDNPRGIATSPVNGHIYVVDLNNGRIDEFTAWGVFARAWGWDVAPDGAPGDTVSDQFEICTTSCKAGVQGNGVGQFSFPKGIALDAAGNVYVYESGGGGEANYRVQKFSSTGAFLLMIGGGVNKGPLHPGNLCTAQHITEGDTCGAGAPGTADGQFSNGSVRNFIAYNAVSDSIFVGDSDRIQELEPDGTFKGEIEFAGEFDGKTVRSLAADPVSGDLYVAFEATANVFRLDRALSVFDEPEDALDVLPVENPLSVATDVEGNVFAVDTVFKFSGEVLGFDPAGAPIEEMENGDGFAAPPGEGAVTTHDVQTVATSALGPNPPESEERGALYVSYFESFDVSYVKAFGLPPIAFELPPPRLPEVKAQYAVSVGTDNAVLKAKINPRFWPDATYYVQYGTGECSSGGCPAEKPLPPGASLTTGSVNVEITTAGVFLTDLEPGTTYRFRFVAQSGGGGPVYGIDPDGKGPQEASVEDGLEGTFRTFPVESDPPPCPSNDEFRTGPAKHLPDCRAYELVSPLEKNNSDVLTLITLSGYLSSLNRSASSGDKLTYSSTTAFAEPEASPIISQYLAERHPLGDPQQGWTSEGLAPPRTRSLVPEAFSDNEFKAFSDDLCSAWLRTEFDPPLTEDAVPEFRNLYRRSNCEPDKGAYEALSTAAPPHGVPGAIKSYEGLQFQGASDDGSHAIFTAPDNLPGTSAPNNENGRLQLYERTPDGQLHFVCILPNGVPTNQACYGGIVNNTIIPQGGAEREGNLDGAITADGQRIFWTESTTGIGPGRIFVRFADEAQSRPISSEVPGTAGTARFWGASANGDRVIFGIEEGASSVDDNLYSFDVDAGQETLVAGDIRGVVGLSEDARRVYFVSDEALPGSGANSEGEAAQAGQANIYLFEEGAGAEPDSRTFVATLSDLDANLGQQASKAFDPSPYFRLSRVSPDGLHAIFMSTVSLTGYDNTDVVSGEPDSEVFHYDAPEAELRCVSCNPSDARPTGVDRRDTFAKQELSKLWQAAQIPTWERPLYATRALSDDGNRVFFESFDRLIPRDTNGVQDVYQWEAEGTGSCDEGDVGYVVDSGEEFGGCIELISSGESPRASSFIDADPSGDDVFISTLSSLVPPDYGLVDVYDARVGGGFPYPAVPPGCEGAACQSPSPPPEHPAPSSASIEGPGNVASPGRKPRCPKGKRRVVRRGKTRCVKKPRKRAQQNRRTAR